MVALISRGGRRVVAVGAGVDIAASSSRLVTEAGARIFASGGNLSRPLRQRHNDSGAE